MMYLDDKATAEGEVVFIENRRTLMETRKLVSETEKLRAETVKLKREGMLYPALVGAAVVTALVGIWNNF